MAFNIEHPEIGWIERTGYPSWMQDDDDEVDEDDEDLLDDEDEDYDDDALYDERREQELFG